MVNFPKVVNVMDLLFSGLQFSTIAVQA